MKQGLDENAILILFFCQNLGQNVFYYCSSIYILSIYHFIYFLFVNYLIFIYLILSIFYSAEETETERAWREEEEGSL